MRYMFSWKNAPSNRAKAIHDLKVSLHFAGELSGTFALTPLILIGGLGEKTIEGIDDLLVLEAVTFLWKPEIDSQYGRAVMVSLPAETISFSILWSGPQNSYDELYEMVTIESEVSSPEAM